MKTLRFILGDQLNQAISSLDGCNKKTDIILMCEVWDEASYVKHHKKKIVFLFSAMRHFANELTTKGYKVDYVKLTNSHNTQSFNGEVQRAIKRHMIERVIITHPGEFRVLEDILHWEQLFNITLELREDHRFLATQEEFKEWASSRKTLRMEYFYRTMRKKHNVLMTNDKPFGGEWNYDQQNRKPPNDNLQTPLPFQVKPDTITNGIIDLVSKKFENHFGEIESFHYAVTRHDALKALRFFIKTNLTNFGQYQDAMLQDQPWMFHSHISLYLNCGLLTPMECIQAASKAFATSVAPLNAVEGFIRQILGWREFIRGLYWYVMPDYANKNFFNAKRTLPDFFWSGKTNMNCLQQCVKTTWDNAYAHHIQRLMVLGNFAMLAGINPREVAEWYLIVYIDAYEWVELPNVMGMALFADGGTFASKPYAASGSYINKMSNYCKQCHYQVHQKQGDKACPFNYLYWNFLLKNKKKLSKNQRMSMIYRTLEKFTPERLNEIQIDSQKFLKQLK